MCTQTTFSSLRTLAYLCLSFVATSTPLAWAGCDAGDSHAVTDAAPDTSSNTHHRAVDAGDDGQAAQAHHIGDRRIPFTPASDRAFIDFFVEHHRMAVEMAKHEVQHGESAEVKALAQDMIDVQSAEIAAMEEIATGLTDSPSPAMPEDPHSQADMEHMASLHGMELDVMFLTDMITHHAGGLPVAHRALKTLDHAELRKLAADMIKAQATEIGMMQAHREQHGVTGAGEDFAAHAEGRADMGLTGDMRLSLTPADDIEFIDFFVPHHEMAMMMAELVVEHGEDAEVRKMAEAMRDSQRAEIEAMRAARARLSGHADSPMLQHDAHMRAEMDSMMMQRGAELDRMFLHEMIPHHASAIPTAHRARPHVQDPELREIADAIFEAQSREVGEMQHMIDEPATP